MGLAPHGGVAPSPGRLKLFFHIVIRSIHYTCIIEITIYRF